MTCLSLNSIQAMKLAGEKITCLTAYDASFAALIDQVGIDMILVGDSASMVMQGHDTTLSINLDEMVYHTQCVTRVRQRSLVIADLPFMTYSTPSAAADSAARLIREGHAQVVKFEGMRCDSVRFLVSEGIPVCGHLGLLPQSINILGTYQVQGKATEAAERIFQAAIALEDAGAAMLVLECVPALLAKRITQHLSIPVIGIGAGPDCDGQVLVIQDLLAITRGKRPRFVKNFMDGAASIEAAIKDYHQAVKNRSFPGPEHSY